MIKRELRKALTSLLSDEQLLNNQKTIDIMTSKLKEKTKELKEQEKKMASYKEEYSEAKALIEDAQNGLDNISRIFKEELIAYLSNNDLPEEYAQLIESPSPRSLDEIKEDINKSMAESDKQLKVMIGLGEKHKEMIRNMIG